MKRKLVPKMIDPSFRSTGNPFSDFFPHDGIMKIFDIPSIRKEFTFKKIEKFREFARRNHLTAKTDKDGNLTLSPRGNVILVAESGYPKTFTQWENTRKSVAEFLTKTDIRKVTFEI